MSTRDTIIKGKKMGLIEPRDTLQNAGEKLEYRNQPQLLKQEPLLR